MRSTYGSTTYGGPPGAALDASPRPAGRRRAAPGRRPRRGARGRGHGLVEPAGALGAAGDQQRRPVRVEAEGARGPRRAARPGRAWRSSGGSAARRSAAWRSGVSGKLVATWSVNRAPSLLAMPGRALPSCTTIGSVPPAGGEVGRHRDVAAEADDDVGADPVDDLQGGLDRAAQPGRDPGQVGVGAARQRHRRDQLERVAGLGDDPAPRDRGGCRAR